MVRRVRSKKSVTAADIRAALVSYYSPPSHRVFFEVSNDTGARARRSVDAVALGIWPSTGYEIVGVEIKTSRSDWKRELADPRKAQELMRFCTRWFLACPDKMVDLAEVPQTWGVLGLRGDTLRQLRPAPLLEPEPLTPGFMMACLRQANGVDRDLVARLVEKAVAAHTQRVEDTVARRVRQQVAEHSRRAESAIKFVEKVGTLTGTRADHWFASLAIDPEALAAAYLLITITGVHKDTWWDGVPGALKKLEEVSDMLRSIHSDERFEIVRSLLQGR